MILTEIGEAVASVAGSSASVVGLGGRWGMGSGAFSRTASSSPTPTT